MMDVRKKLVDIVCDAMESDGCIGHCNHSPCFEVERVVNALIDNGVTVQECGYWVSLTDCANAGVYCSVCHKKVYKEDYAWCNRKNKLRSDYCPHCGAKMMPQPPKGE